MAALLASCAAQPEETEPSRWEFPAPEGLFVVYEIEAAGSVGRFGLIDAEGELVVPMHHTSIGVVHFLDGSSLPVDWPASERFFTVFEPVEPLVRFDRPLSKALISPEGNFLTGFHYSEIHLVPGDPTRMVALRTDDPHTLVFLDQYGAESPVDDPDLLYNFYKQNRVWMWESELAEGRQGPDVPEGGFDWVMVTRAGNYWGAVTIEPDSLTDSFFEQEVRLFSEYGVLISPDVYQSVFYIGDGFYQTFAMTGESGWESFIVDQNGRRLAGPYDDFHRDFRSSFVLGLIGDTAHVMNVDAFLELWSIERPQDGGFQLRGSGDHPVVSIHSETRPLTIIRLDTGAEIVFEDFPGHMFEANNRDFTRFVLFDMAWDDMAGFNNKLVDLEGNILASASSLDPYAFEEHDILIALDMHENEWIFRLIDWDGKVLLEGEYTHLEPLPGNALRVTRNEATGIIDFGGNWIYIQPQVG